MDSSSGRQAPDVTAGAAIGGSLSSGVPGAHVGQGQGAGPPLDFRVLFDQSSSYVSASLGRLGIAPSDRDDLVVEVFVRVHRELARYDASRPLRPWLFAFAARVASEHRRLARHRREVLGDEHEAMTAATTAAPDQAMETAEAKKIVERGLDALDDDKRAVFVLHDLDETPVPEIARVLGIAEGTAYSRLRAARAELTAAIRRIQATEGSRAAPVVVRKEPS